MPTLPEGFLDPFANKIDEWIEKATGGKIKKPDRTEAPTDYGVFGADGVDVNLPGAGLLDWAKNLFSINTGARFAAVIVGLILLGAAVWALMNASKS